MNQYWPPPPPQHGSPPPGRQVVAQPGPSVGWAVGLWIVAGLSLVGTLLLGFLAGYGFWISHHMAAEGVAATAVVTEVDCDDDVRLDFTVDGQPVSTELTWLPFDLPEVDDQIQITYDPDDVTYVVLAGSSEDRALAIGFLVVAYVGLLVSLGTATGAILIHRARSRNAQAARAGPPIG